MSLFSRSRRTQRTATPTPDPIVEVDVDAQAILREEFEVADRTAGPVLARIARTRAILDEVAVDVDRGSAILTFEEGTRITVATAGEEILQLRSAARLTDARLVYSHVRSDGPGRVLAFTAAHWNIFLLVDIAHV